MFRTWWQKLFTFPRTRLARRRGYRPPSRLLGRTTRLSMTYLEDRITPANKIWTGAVDANWSNGANWIGGTPGAADVAVFDITLGGTNNASTIDAGFAGSVAGINIANYSGTIT